MQSKLKWTTLFLAAVVLVLGNWFLPRGLPKEKKLKVENFHKVAIGRTLAEVEELLGGPEGNYGPNPKEEARISMEAGSGPEAKVWVNVNNRFEISFDSTDRVVSIYKRASYQQRLPETFFGRAWRDMRAYFGF